jgi:hypothetical protein
MEWGGSCASFQPCLGESVRMVNQGQNPNMSHCLVKATFRVEDQDHNIKDSNLKNIDSSCNCLKD